ncbi:bifunctional nuclease family protein [Flexithrix dorotheae]|uniref:bifunctional nuclease family protein n=1 Tax=Flexithrix dorotheae TaxID=70993 RepID=UPI0003635436|nr:bifunctional nuclease family protein [Flexithrix dorotheae]
MDKIKLEILGLSASHSQSGSFALVLGEELGNRRLPIIIGMFEAQAIAIEMEKIVSNRPMTHDLFKSLAINFDIDVHEIIISDLKEGVFYAKIICSFRDGSNFIELDARPSDAVAIALRFDVPIYANENILEEAGIVLNEEDEGNEKPAKSKKSPVVKASQDSEPLDTSQLNSISIDQLKSMMEAALTKEDYEKAAKIRDELNRRQA